MEALALALNGTKFLIYQSILLIVLQKKIFSIILNQTKTYLSYRIYMLL